MGRAPCCEKVGLKRGKWTTEEDEILMKYIQTNGEGSWRSLPKNAGLLRCGKSCRLRWINYLRADLKRGNISEEEENTIIKLHGSFGNRWSLIAAQLPGRTDNEIKNYWNSHLSRRIYSSKRLNSDGVNVAKDMEVNKMVGRWCKRKCGGRTSRLAMKKNKIIERLRESHEKSGDNLSIMERVKQKEERESMTLLSIEDSGSGFVGSNEGGVESEVMCFENEIVGSQGESEMMVFSPSEERESEIICPNGMVEKEVVGSNKYRKTWALGSNEDRESGVNGNNEEKESQILGVNEARGGDREDSSCDFYSSLSNCIEGVDSFQEELVSWNLEGMESTSWDLEGLNTTFWKNGDHILSWLWEEDDVFEGQSLGIENCDEEKSYAAWLMSTDQNAI